MKLVVVGRVQPQSPNALLDIMRNFNAACNYLSSIAFNERIFSWLPLQRRAYHELRTIFGLTSAQAVCVIRKVAYSYKGQKTAFRRFTPLGSMPLYSHSYKRTGEVLIYGVRYPMLAAVPLSAKAQATLLYHKGKFLIHQPMEVEERPAYRPRGYLGCDLGIVNILADSDGAVYAGATLNGLRKRHERVRQRLQKKGTKSAKRLLKKRRRKETLFARDVNHCISKQVVTKAYDTLRGIALEDLSGISKRITVRVRKAQRRTHHSWGFYQLRTFIEYKAGRLGVPVLLVDPRNTSRVCPRCGTVDKANRKTQALFLCIGCGFSGFADTIAAGNIARRAVSNQPHAASSQDSCESRCAFKG